MERVLRGYDDSLRIHEVCHEIPRRGNRWIDRLAVMPGLILDFTGGERDFNDEEVAAKAENRLEGLLFWRRFRGLAARFDGELHWDGTGGAAGTRASPTGQPRAGSWPAPCERVATPWPCGCDHIGSQ